MGMIPNVKKTNQDSHLEVKDLGNLKGLWMFGVMDGHGVNGHHVSDFVRKHLPNVLGSLIEGGNGYDAFNTRNSLVSGKKSFKKSVPTRNNYLPSLIGNMPNNKGSRECDDSYWLTEDPQIRDNHIRESFRIVEEKLENQNETNKIDSMFSGTTVVVVLMQGNTIVCANCGDSRAILCS
jgi:serine/threonine protein phosphatase PrpC